MRALVYIGYIILGFLQIAAFAAGLNVWLGIPIFLGFIIAMFVGPMPVVGTILGMVGAHSAWGWSWFAAFMLFFGWLFVLFVGAAIGGVFERKNR